jgi:hypothetical protein
MAAFVAAGNSVHACGHAGGARVDRYFNADSFWFHAAASQSLNLPNGKTH